MSSWIAIAVIVILMILIFVWVGLISYNLGLIRRSQRILTRGMSDNTLQEILAQHFVRVDGLEDRIANNERNIDTLHDIQLGAIQRVGMIKYDAFSDMGGELSFALALLNEHGDGIVVSTITGRQDNRTYAKQVRNGRPVLQPSAEETEAINQAMSGR